MSRKWFGNLYKLLVLEQVIPAQNWPANIRAYICQQNEIKLLVLLYDLSTGKFLGLDLRLAYILRGNPDEVFLNYIYNAETSRALFSPSKDKIPNTFTSTALIKHYSAIVDECHRTNNLLQQIERSQSINIQKMSLWIQLNLFMKTLKFISTTKRISPSTFRFKCEWYLQQSCRNV